MKSELQNQLESNFKTLMQRRLRELHDTAMQVRQICAGIENKCQEEFKILTTEKYPFPFSMKFNSLGEIQDNARTVDRLCSEVELIRAHYSMVLHQLQVAEKDYQNE